MGREKETYRDNLEMLLEQYPGGEHFIRLEDLMELLGVKSKEAIKKDETLLKCGLKVFCGRWGISVAGLARALS